MSFKSSSVATNLVMDLKRNRPLLASPGGLLSPPSALLFFSVYSIFASSLPKLWSLFVNITGRPGPV